MSLSPGDKLGPYEILAPIGAGGMGEIASVAGSFYIVSELIEGESL